MAKRHPKSQPTWTDVEKHSFMSFDRPGLLGLIQDLYAAHRDNQTFLHARFGLGEDILGSPTRKRWTAGSGRMRYGTRIRPSWKRQTGHLQLQKRLSANRTGSRS